MSVPPANLDRMPSSNDQLQSLYHRCHVQNSPASTLTGSSDSSPSGSPPPAAVPSSFATSDHVPGSRREHRSPLSTKPADALPLVGGSTAAVAGSVAASSLDGLDQPLAKSGPSFRPTVEPETPQGYQSPRSGPSVPSRTHVPPVLGRASRTLSREQLSPPLAELGPSSSVARDPVPSSITVSPDIRFVLREISHLSLTELESG